MSEIAINTIYNKPSKSKDSGVLFNNFKDELLTIDDLSKFLKVNKKTIYGWIYQGKIKPLKVGGLVRFARSYINQWVFKQGD